MDDEKMDQEAIRQQEFFDGMKINGVKYTAPVFKNAEFSDLEAVAKHLSSASFHYADDSGREWGLAKQEVAKAAKLANDLGLSVGALTHLHSHKPQLVSLNDFIDAVLKTARSQA